ncbi:MAG: segregation/condensation protein A [Actinomycetaceae bacterium]|nr:segregation/condensation protein A [Actinomycetaceae bacterium]
MTTSTDEKRSIFHVELNVFQGPFSVLLSLIARKRLDVTEIALAEVTDEFLDFIRIHKNEENLSHMSEFIVTAATLLELKAYRLLPRSHQDKDEDLELLEQRDLLFAKLLQYKAYKEIAHILEENIRTYIKAFTKQAPLEEHFLSYVPPMRMNISLDAFASIADDVFTEYATRPTTVSLEHLHRPQVTVSSQVDFWRTQLSKVKTVIFSEMCKGVSATTVVSRFMAVLELLRAKEIITHQDRPLHPITIEKIRNSAQKLRIEEY